LFDFARVKAIIFDLDDTLVKTSLDFELIKKQIECPKEADILSFIDSLECDQLRREAHKIVLEHEMQDAHTSIWMPGAQEFVNNALARELPLAIVTRNCREATRVKIDNNQIPISIVLTREDAPAKPDPTALHMVNQHWQLQTHEVAYIGDYKYDIEAAQNASMQAWLFEPNNEGICFAKNLRLML